MRSGQCKALVLLGLVAAAPPSSAQTVSRLVGCLGQNGTLYGIRPEGQLGEACSGSDLQVRLGSGTIESVTPGPGLIGGGISGDVGISLDPKMMLPPGCPPGQVALSDEQGGWVCASPSLFGRRNPAGKLWVIPRLDVCQLPGETDRIRLCRQQTYLTVVNPGAATARVTFLTFDNRGRLNLLPSSPVVLAPGAMGFFGAPRSDQLPGARVVWGLLASDQEILPTVYFRSEREDGSRTHQIEAYPVDCREPAGYEFACQFAESEEN